MINRFTLISLVLLLGACTNISDDRPEVVRKSEYYLENGVRAYTNSDYATAAELFTRALAHYRSVDDREGILLSLINLAETALASGNPEQALRQLEATERLLSDQQLKQYSKRIQLLRAQAHWHSGAQQAAMPLLTPLLPQFDQDGRPRKRPIAPMVSAVILRTDIAFSHLETQPDEARQWLQRLDATLAQSSPEMPLHTARRDRFQARLEQQRGNTDAALTLLEGALERYRSAIKRPAIAATLSEMAQLNKTRRQWRLAAEQLERALYIRLWIMDRRGSRENLHQLAAVYEQLGQTARAERARTQAEAIERDGEGLNALRKERLAE
ncbi:MAG: tetratricopeptide repeat protein [Pseudomonadota bacterium]